MEGLRPGEAGFMLLTSNLGDPSRKPLTVAQFRTLTERARLAERVEDRREIDVGDIIAMGYGTEMAQRIWKLLQEEELLAYYLNQGKKQGCYPITRATEDYPPQVRRKLGLDSPGVLWARGDRRILTLPRISLVGSRELGPENQRFAAAVGREAARQGYALVSGNARGADQTAQNACLEAGGSVISVVADALQSHRERERVLYLSEQGYQEPFSAQRALSRNRVIHAISEMTFVAQCRPEKGGTWSGTAKNLSAGWSSVYCFADGSEASRLLSQRGAICIGMEALKDISELFQPDRGFF